MGRVGVRDGAAYNGGGSRGWGSKDVNQDLKVLLKEHIRLYLIYNNEKIKGGQGGAFMNPQSTVTQN